MATSDENARCGMTVLDRVMRNVDHAAVALAERQRIAREREQRIAYLYGRLFRNVIASRDVARLRTESQASDMFRRAHGQNQLQIEILHVAVDNRWGSVVNAFIKLWDGEHPIAGTVQELWNLTLTTGRSAV